MWVFVKDGFFSVHNDQYCSKREVVVRTRCKFDIERLRFSLLNIYRKESDIPEIIHTPNADYHWRIIVTKYIWGCYLKKESEKINYHGIKNTLTENEDEFKNEKRYHAYYKVWEAMFDISD